MQLHIFHTVNSGLYVTKGNDHLLIDGIFDGSAVGFSPMPSVLRKQFLENEKFFPYLNHLLFTHTHKDHFDENALLEFLPKARPVIFSPDPRFRNIERTPLSSGLGQIPMGNFQIFVLDTIHDGPQFVNLPHCSYFIQLAEESLFITGDAVLTEKDAACLLEHNLKKPNAVFLNLYQTAHPSVHDFLRRMEPQRVFLYHLPFPKDDVFQIHLSMRSALKKYPDDLPAIEVLSPMTWIDRKIPSWFIMQNN